MAFRVIKQFIPNGQPGDPDWARRDIYVWRITSGSYSGSDDISDDHEEGYYDIDQLERDDYEDYQGWGVYTGTPRVYGLMEEISGSYPFPSKEELKDAKNVSRWRKTNPIIHSFAPLTASEGQIVRISGSDFLGTAKVGFSWRKTKELRILDNNNIRVRVPSGSETGFLTVYNYNQEFDKADGWMQISGTQIQSPTFGRFVPRTGSYYTPITLFGDNLQYTKRLRVGNVIVNRNQWVLNNNHEITFYIPAGAQTNPVRLVDFDNNVFVTPEEVYVEPEADTNIQTFYPTYAPYGDILHIWGSRFLGVTAVAVHQTTGSFTIVNDNHIRFTLPENASPHRIRVQNSQSLVASSGEDFIWMPGVSSKKATINDFNPKTGSAGDRIYVTGSQFLGTIGGYINDTGSELNMRQVEIYDRRHMSFRIPPGSSTGYFRIRNNIGLKISPMELYII